MLQSRLSKLDVESVLLLCEASMVCSKLLALHQLAVLRHDEYCQETLLNLLIRSFLHYNLYEQVRS